MKIMYWVAIVMALTAMNCATKKYVSTEIEASEVRTQTQMQELERVVEETQTEIRDLARELNLEIEGLEDNTKRLAGEAEKLGESTQANSEAIARMGHLSFQKTLSDAEAFFSSDSSDLNENVMGELDKFAQLIKSQNKVVHLEIQGHTDSRGSEKYNLELGRKRAEAVRDYLYKEHDFPLHLMNVISMGSEEPIASNDDRDGRARNRRVVLVVRIKL